MESDDNVLVLERRGPISVLRLNRPEARNALNPELIDRLGSGLAEAEDDPEVRVVVLTGTGDRAFCAGMDLRSFAGDVAPAGGRSVGAAAFRRFTRGEVNIPVVGAANATAVAGGFEILLGCDMIVASQAASFGFPEVKRGLIAAGGGVFVSTRIPLAIALELTLTGDLIDSSRALALGLINQVVPADQLLPAALDLARRVARNGPLAVEASRELVRAAAGDLERAQARLADWLPRVFESEDAREGAIAFVERREPVWRGR